MDAGILKASFETNFFHPSFYFVIEIMPQTFKLPKRAIVIICVLTFSPFFLQLLGFNFSSPAVPDWLQYESVPKSERAYYELSGSFLQSLLEWSAFGIALMTALLSMVHYRIRRDITTPIIGTAMFFTGMLDAFSSLAASRLLFLPVHSEQFFPFIWMVARTFSIVILVAGTLPFLFSPRSVFRASQSKPRELGSLVLLGLLFGLMAYAIIHIFSGIVTVPTSVFPERVTGGFVRPWDAIPLLLMLFAGGIVFPRFHRLHPSLFSHSLKWSMLPAVMAQLHVCFGASSLFDSNFNIACFLKIVAYSVLLIGLILDYIRAYHSETVLQLTESKLLAAREIQQSLLPQSAPAVDGFDLAGFSFPAEAVGGDYFDYIPIKEGACGVVVADVSGHDLGASLLMSQTRAYLRAMTEAEVPASKVLSRLDHFLAEDTQSRRFVTLVYLHLIPNAKSIEYCTAGHQSQLIRADGSVVILNSGNLPLCANEGDLKTSVTPTLVEGDILLLATDGLLEAASPAGEQYGLERALEFIRRARDLPASEIVERLYWRVQEFCNNQPPTDDVTLVLVKYTGNDPTE